ncbi:MAG: Ig-like domain-containing protein [Balneolaceae bacterium]
MLLLALVWFVGCATPIAPTGGPPDREGPTVESTNPQTGTVNFDGDEVQFNFSEFIDRASVQQNVTIEPNLGIQFDVNFGRTSATVEFESELPENTTIIVQLGSEVSDTRNNEMGSSFELALSTGPELDDGNVTARLRDSIEGSVESGERVFLYRIPADFSEPANYLAQSDTSGAVNFSYLKEGRYTALWMDDVNRDRTWNPDREYAQPFHINEFEVEKGEEFDLGTIFIQRPDTTAPRIDGVGLLSESRLRLRLSEAVDWQENAYITVNDSLSEEFTTAYPLYISIEDPQVIYAQSLEGLSDGETFLVEPHGFYDQAENSLVSAVDGFEGSAEPDTSSLRLIEDNSSNGLFMDEPLEITYSEFIEDESVVDSLRIIRGDQEINDWEYVEVERNKLIINPEIIWEAGTRYEFRVWDPYQTEYATIRPDMWQNNELGEIEFTVDEPDSTMENRLILRNDTEKVDIDTVFVRSIEIDNLPPLEYNARIYRDLNENGRWDSGSIDPYVAPEPYFLQRNIPVREGFTSEVPVEFESVEPDSAGEKRDILKKIEIEEPIDNNR